jgi:lipopolysaccharide export system permease protein
MGAKILRIIPWPRRIDRYVLSEVLGPFLGGNIFFIFILLMFQALRLADFFIVHGVPAQTLGQMTLLMSLSFFPTTLPAAFLIAVLVGFGRLSADSELVAMKANGMSILRLSAPMVAFALIVVSLSLVLNMEWVPWGERMLKRTLIKVGNTKIVSSVHEGTFTPGFFDLLIFADKVDTKTNHMSHVFIYDEREPKNPLAVVASGGEVLTVRTNSALGAAAVLKLKDGSIHRNDLVGKTYQKIDFKEYRLFLKVDEGVADDVTKPHMLPYGELEDKIRTTDTSTWEGKEWRMEYWRRYATAISPLIFVFLGMGFGTVRTRAVRAGAVLTALVTLACYWGIQTGSMSAAQHSYLNPFWAMQMPNLVILIAAVIGFRKASW